MKSFFSIGLRPFFLLTAISAIFFPMYLVCVVYNFYPFPGELLDVFRWHGHELLFGMIPSLLAGFLLTASSNWTGTKPLNGLPLALLVILWLVTRIIFFFFQTSPILLLLTGPLFLIVLTGVMFKKLQGNRNLIIITSLLSLFTTSQISYLYGYFYFVDPIYNAGLIAAYATVFMFLFVFSGRLIPFFTNSRFQAQLIHKNTKLELTILISAIIFFILEIVGISESVGLAVLAFALFIMLTIRSIIFYHHKIWEESMVYCLHLAHTWLPIFFALKGFENLFPLYAVGLPSLHALLVGGLGMFAVSIMARASMGHTGRPIVSSPLMLLTFTCILIGAFLRVFEPIISQDMTPIMTHSSMGFWTLGFVFFLIKFTPNYLKPRPDGKPY